MPVKHVSPSALKAKHPNAACADCRSEPDVTRESQLWTIWAPDMYYCPKCAAAQGIGPESR